jgi:hypothetical protein
MGREKPNNANTNTLASRATMEFLCAGMAEFKVLIVVASLDV